MPSAEKIAARLGTGARWQDWALGGWIARLARDEDGIRVAVLDAQVRLRGQPELATPDMDCFAAYMCGQADTLDLPIIDTTVGTPAEGLGRLREMAEALL